jgi:hypothetical protein
MGVSTTRALSLVVSGSETVRRPWYSGAAEVRCTQGHAHQRGVAEAHAPR